MQLKIYKFLNTLNVIVLSLVIGVILWVTVFFPIENSQTRNIFFIVLGVLSIIYFLVFKYLENRWDKNLMLKMLGEKKIALAKILSAGAVKQIRESNFKNFIIYKLELEVIKKDLSTMKLTCYEKFNSSVDKVPNGHVYITFDENNHDVVFIIQNDLIARYFELEPIVKKYEKNVKDIRYLSVVQNNGLIIKTFQQQLKGN